jgi:hypothetical protein
MAYWSDGKALASQTILTRLPAGRIERHHQQMEVDRQGVHHRHFAGQGAHYAGHGRCEHVLIAEPRMLGLEVAFHRMVGPIVQFLLQCGLHCLRLQAERIATEIAGLLPVQLRMEKTLAVAAQRVCGIQLPRVVKGVEILHGGKSRKAERIQTVGLEGRNPAILGRVAGLWGYSRSPQRINGIDIEKCVSYGSDRNSLGVCTSNPDVAKSSLFRVMTIEIPCTDAADA